MPAASLGLGALIAGSIGSIAIKLAGSFAASLVLGGISRALAPKPKAPQGISFAGRTVTVRQPAQPRQWVYGRARVGGTFVWMHARDNVGGDQWLHLAVVLAGHECDAIEEIWFDDYRLTLDADGWERGRYNVTPATLTGSPEGDSYVRVRQYLGTTGQEADPLLTQFSDGKWTAHHRLAGCTYLAILLTSNPDMFPNGIPQISAVVRGRKVYDDRTGVTAWTDNNAVILAHYLRTALGATVNAASVIAAASVCDEPVPLAAGGTEKRYACNGALTLDQEPRRVINDLANSMAGYAIRSGGEWHLEAGAYVAPSISLTDADLRAPDRVRTRISRRENFNAVRGVFSSPANYWQPDDFPPVRSTTYLDEDSGIEAWKDIELPYTTSASLAQRLAKIDLLRARQQISREMPCKLSALRVRAGSVVSVSSDFYGWVAKPFRVRGVTLVVEQDDDGNPVLGVDLSTREIAANVYDWSASEEQPYDAAPDTNLPDPFTITAPGVPTVTESLYETTGSAGVKARATVSWGASTSAFVDTYQVELAVAASNAWTVYPRTPATTMVIEDIAPGLYDVRVKAISQRGVSSAWQTRRFEIIGLAGRPADVTGLTLQAISSIAVLQWTLHPDLDVRVGGKILVRHSELMSGATWEDSYSVVEALPGAATIALVPLKGGTYLVRAMDSSGQQSENVATINTKAASVLAFSTLASVTEDPTFGGSKSGCVVESSTLRLSGAGQFDVITDLDAVANLDAFGGFTGSGTYTFASGIDLGTVKRVRLTTTLAVETIEAVTLWDGRADPIDDWLDTDGPAAGGVGDVVIEVRETDDDPAGTPTWSAWRRLVTADYEARAFQFRALLSVSDPAYNIQITQLRVAAAEVT